MPDPADSLPVVPKSSSQPGMQPTPQELVAAELALNAGDGILYARMADNTVLPVRARPLGGYGRGTPGTFDGGCVPPAVTETGDVIPGVVSQPAPGAFRIIDYGCNAAEPCAWSMLFNVPAGMSAGAFMLQGELADAAGNTVWADIKAAAWAPLAAIAADATHAITVPCNTMWTQPQASGGLSLSSKVGMWSPGWPNSPLNPTGRYRVYALLDTMYMAGPAYPLTGDSMAAHRLTDTYQFPGPGGVPTAAIPGCCVCDPPDPPGPPDYGSWAVVDDGEDTRYDCVGGVCVARPTRQYAVRFRLYPPDGVTSFATEADAIAKRDQMTTQGGQYATMAACQSACVAGAWVVTASGTVTRYRCTGGNCNSANSQQYSTYTVAFSAGAAVTGPASNGGAFATQQEANAWVSARTLEMTTAHPYATLGDCQIALGEIGCAPMMHKCVTTVADGVTTRTCTPIASSDAGAALASGAQLFSTQARCETGCATPTGLLLTVAKCSTYSWFDDPPNNAIQLSQAYTCAGDLAQRGWEAVAVTRAVAVNACGGATSNVVTISARCPGTPDYGDLGTARTLLRFNVTGSIGWYEDQFRAARCVPNPAP